MSTNKEDDRYFRIVYVPDEDDWTTDDQITLPGFMVACMVTIVPMFVMALGAVIMWSKYYG